MKTQPVLKVIGEGGAHLHKLSANLTSTEKDGIHKHLFFVNDRLLMTDLSGAHQHSVSATNNTIGSAGAHMHTVRINTQDGPVSFDTDSEQTHQHELQSESTTLSGLHTHMLDIGEERYISLLPGDLLDAVEQAAKKEKNLKDFKVQKSDDPMELNFSLLKRLNKEDFKEVLCKAVLASITKSLSRLKDGLQVESLVLSRERFFDLGAATRFVLDAGLAINGADERDDTFLFNVRARSRFDEASLQRVRLTDGVEAVVGLLNEEEVENQEGGTKETADIDQLTDRNKDTDTNEKGNSVGIAAMKSRFAALIDDEAPVAKAHHEDKGGKKKDKRNIQSQITDIAKKYDSESVLDTETLTDVLCKADEKTITRRFIKYDHMEDHVDSMADLHSRFASLLGDDEAEEETTEETSKVDVRFDIVKRDDDQRIVTGPVLIPENVDLQDDIVSSAEIEKAAHNYMIKLNFRDDPTFLKKLGLNKNSKRGFMHVEFNRKIALVESYMAPVNFVLKLDNKKTRNITKGTWVMSVKVFDDEVWNLVKAGRITGFSIGGRSRSVHEPDS